jgi:tetratricopeptide (TPR) repeat protein
MVDPDRRPTAHEIEELIDLVRRDPGSPAFIDLGDAYLALGRPRDAIQVGHLGLEAAPDNLEGRVMLARAHAAMHQWKDAQAELLRVVKVDRSNRQGFALLGEVLMRRNDFERAVPVLQHAQNLDPTSPAILTMLRRARAGQALDPPAPVPMPIPPRGETNNDAEIIRSQMRAATPPAPGPTSQPRSRAIPVPAMPGPGSSPPMPAMAEPQAAYAPTLFPPGSGSRPQKASGPPPQQMSVEGVRPRVVASSKVYNAAAASLRQSAAVGESYLNDLLTGGLLDVAGVRVPDADFDLRPDRRWGRSTRRAFIFLFIVLVFGLGGGGTWYWWSEKQKGEAVARLQREAKTAIGDGTLVGLQESATKLIDALKKDENNTLTFAYVVEMGGLTSLLYGTPSDEVDRAYKQILKDIGPDDPGAREIVIGHAAMELSRLHTLEAPKTALDDVNKQLDGYLAKHADDRWAKWLKGRAMWAAGERKGARATFKAAGEGDGGLVVALVDYANILIDDGELEEGLAQLKKANDRSKDHPLVVLASTLAKAEASLDTDEVIGDLNAKFVESKLPPRLAAYRQLALALASINIDEYNQASEALTKATASNPPGEPRFWARVAWVDYALGDLAAAAQARNRCVWYSNAPEPDPTARLVNAALNIASGLPEKALDVASKIDGVRPRLLRTQALIDLGRARDALGEADEVLKIAPKNVQAQILREQARMIASEGKERAAAADALESLARSAKTKLGRHALGAARMAVNDLANAKAAFEQALQDVSDVQPHPVAYRTLTALAEIALAEGKMVEAGRYLDWSLNGTPKDRPEITFSNGTKLAANDPVTTAGNAKATRSDFIKPNTGYFPTLALQAKVVLRNNEADRALDMLKPIISESAAITTSVQMTLAEALIVHSNATAENKKQARQILEELKGKADAPPAELGRIAALLGKDVPKELGLPEPSESGSSSSDTPKKKRRR